MDQLTIARKSIQSAERIVVLSGAGISAASGVPINAVNHSPTSFLTTVTTEMFRDDPEKVWRLHLDLREELAWCLPNPAHVALRTLFERKPHVVLTQNIDGLHEESGHPNVCVLHGTIWKNQCTSCHRTRNARVEVTRLPRCPSCGALERPNIVWIGDALKRATLIQAFTILQSCDVLLVVGTSAHVAPVSSFADLAKLHDATVIEVNPNPSGFVPSDISLCGAAEDVLPALCAA